MNRSNVRFGREILRVRLIIPDLHCVRINLELFVACNAPIIKHNSVAPTTVDTHEIKLKRKNMQKRHIDENERKKNVLFSLCPSTTCLCICFYWFTDASFYHRSNNWQPSSHSIGLPTHRFHFENASTEFYLFSAFILICAHFGRRLHKCHPFVGLASVRVQARSCVRARVFRQFAWDNIVDGRCVLENSK